MKFMEFKYLEQNQLYGTYNVKEWFEVQNYICMYYHNLLVNSCGLYSSHPRIIASGCYANTVINVAIG